MRAFCRLRQPGPPDPVAVDPPRAFHPDFAAVVPPRSRLVSLYGQASWAEGPAWWARQETLVFSDVVGRRVLGWRADGAVEVLIDATAFINGNAIDRDDRMVHCEHGRRAITRTVFGPPRSRTGGAGARAASTDVIADRVEGQRLNSPNDLIVASDGTIWFTDPTFGILNPKQGCPATPDLDHTSVYRLLPGAAEPIRMADLHQPNGLAFAPGERTLYVSQTPEDGDEIAIFAFAWDGTRLSDRRRFIHVPHGVPDGFCVDRRGWLWSSSERGVEVFSSEGVRLGEIPTPHVASNCTFDSLATRLFVTGRENLWMLPLADQARP